MWSNIGDPIAELNRFWYLACWVHAHRMIDFRGYQAQRFRTGYRLPFQSSSRRTIRRRVRTIIEGGFLYSLIYFVVAGTSP